MLRFVTQTLSGNTVALYPDYPVKKMKIPILLNYTRIHSRSTGTDVVKQPSFFHLFVILLIPLLKY